MAAERVESIAVHSLFITFTCSIVLFQYLEVLVYFYTYCLFGDTQTNDITTSPEQLRSRRPRPGRPWTWPGSPRGR